jgi:hypothetical protein
MKHINQIENVYPWANNMYEGDVNELSYKAYLSCSI